MDALSRLKLMIGPVRPFIVGKVKDAWRCSVRSWTLDSRIPASLLPELELRFGLSVIPSHQWLREYGSEVRKFAEQVASGNIYAYGITTWKVGDPFLEIPDYRGVLELARMHQWCAYALMAHLDAQHKEEWKSIFITELNSFVESYPAPSGPMWSVAMDVGIRVHTMLVAWDWFRQAGISDSVVDSVVARCASDHAFVIDARLERAGGMATSHYLGDLLGLISVGAYVLNNDELTDLAAFAASELKNEMRDQILDDGLDFEASTGYHRHVTDILVRCTRLLLELPFTHYTVEDSWWQRLSSAIQAQHVLNVYGMPLIGDNDDGMAIKLTGFQPDTSAMLDEALRFLPLKNSIFDFSISRSFDFSSFGLWFYNFNDLILSVRCGTIGQYGKGGHAHNDMNSITLSVHGEQVIVDPGSAWYSGDRLRRNADRSVRNHATVMVNNKEHAEFRLGGGEDLWWLLNEPSCDVDARQTSWQGTVGSGRQRHTRTIEFGSEIRIQDDIPINSRGVIYVPLAPEIRTVMYDDHAELSGVRSKVLLSWSNATAHIEPSRISRAFGTSEDSTTLVLKMRESRVHWTIAPIFAAHEA